LGKYLYAVRIACGESHFYYRFDDASSHRPSARHGQRVGKSGRVTRCISSPRKCLLESLRNAKGQNTPFQTRGPKRAVETTERQGTQLYTFRFGRARNGTRVQLWISYMHIVREPETALGSNYGFATVILLDWIGAGSGVWIQSSPMQALSCSRIASADPVVYIVISRHFLHFLVV
jgi:hypothetical protein